jgi:hypothetical protein
VNLPLASLAAVAQGLGVSVSELTLAIDGPLPREVRTLEQMLAGRGRREQLLLSRVLTSMVDMIAEVKGDASEDA